MTAPALPLRSRVLVLRAALQTVLTGQHSYIATGCLHGDHGYCAGRTGAVGVKTPARCKFCQAPCICPCGHR